MPAPIRLHDWPTPKGREVRIPLKEPDLPRRATPVGRTRLPDVQRWLDPIAARPVARRGITFLAERRRQGPVTKEWRENMFGTRQSEVR